MAISTTNATTTTRAEIINPWTMGRMPDFFMLANEVFKPIAARAETMKNLLADLVCTSTGDGMVKMLATTDIATKATINQGKIFQRLKFAFNSLSLSPLIFASLRLRARLIKAKIKTVGMMESVLVSFTMVAKSPAASEKAYPVATTDDVSFTAVPAQSPKAISLKPIALPMIGKSKIIAISNKKVADMA